MIDADDALNTHDSGGRWAVAGHHNAVRALAASLASPAHAYLLTGPRGIGKRTLAVELAKGLNCEAGSDRPCQMCWTCRSIGRQVHPDVSYIEPEDQEQIFVGRIRELRQELALLPSQARWRVVIVRAGALTESAADALLKTLEEPNPRVVLTLTAQDAHSIPETIVSRCRCFTLGFVSPADIGEELMKRQVDLTVAENLAALSYGAIGWAIRASQNADLARRREDMRANLARWAGTCLLDRLSAAEVMSSGANRPDRNRSLVIEDLEIMIAWWRDVLVATTGRDDLIVNTLFRDEIQEVAGRQTPDRAMSAIRSIAVAAGRIFQNVDPRLTLEALAVSIPT